MRVYVVGPLAAVNTVYLTLTSAALFTPPFPKAVLQSNHSDGKCFALHLITECVLTCATHSDLECYRSINSLIIELHYYKMTLVVLSYIGEGCFYFPFKAVLNAI